MAKMKFPAVAIGSKRVGPKPPTPHIDEALAPPSIKKTGDFKKLMGSLKKRGL